MFSFLIIGLIAGFVATHMMKGAGDNLLRNLAIGTGGAFIGNIAFQVFDFFVIEIIVSTLFAFLSAVAAIWIAERMRGEKKQPPS
jgi:uncharacterized membrane protein YeaQ/YmgE (transglycosylase-associated protein family)